MLWDSVGVLGGGLVVLFRLLVVVRVEWQVRFIGSN